MWLSFREQQTQSCAFVNHVSQAGFESVSWVHCQPILDALDLLNSASQTGFSQSRQRLRIRRKLHKMPQGRLTAHDTEEIKRILALCREMQSTKTCSDLLDEGSFWSAQFDVARTDRTLYHHVMKLSGQWVREGRYARYSTVDLLFIYEEVLPLFANWLHYAQKELAIKGYRLKPALKLTYTAYLDGLLKELKMEEKTIRASLLSRITAFSEEGAFNPVFAFISRLQRFVTKMPNEFVETASIAPEPLTPRQFNQVRQIIERDGQAEEKGALYALPYYEGLSDFDAQQEIQLTKNTAYRKAQTGRFYRLPAVVQSEIPFSPPFYFLWLPQFLWVLFKDAQIRYQFFQHETCQFLVMVTGERLGKDPLPVDTSIVNLPTTPLWQASVDRLGYLAREEQRTQTAIASLSTFFHQRTQHLLNTYQNWLQQEATQTLSHQIQQLTTYLERRANVQPLTQADRLQLKACISTFKIQNRQWRSGLGLALLILRTHLLEMPELAENLPSFVQKSSDQMTMFERFYTDLLSVIHDYESTHSPLLPEDETHLHALKTILKAQEKQQDVITLRDVVVTYHQVEMKAKNTHTGFNLFLATDNELTQKLDTLLHQRDYQETTLSAKAQVTESMQRNEQWRFLDHVAIQLKIPEENPIPENITFSGACHLFQFAWIKNPLEKDREALKHDMQVLQGYQQNTHLFKSHALVYLYYFVTALANLPSKAEFEQQLPTFRYLLTALINMDQSNPIGLGGFLDPLKTAEAHLSDATYCNRWDFFVKNHFELIANLLHQKYVAAMGVPKVARVNAINQQVVCDLMPPLPHSCDILSPPLNR